MNINSHFFLVCIYQPGKDVEWTPCASPQDQVKTKTLKLIKSKVEKCPEIKVLSKNCKDGKKNHKKATGMYLIHFVIIITFVPSI